MGTVKVQHAKTHLSALLHAVEQGEEFVIARGDRPVARLVPVVQGARSRELGFLPIDLPDSFFAPLDTEELDAWEGA
ncbi:MAG: type II toxin-antitoxin system Phd/YefM family antitoxin [Propionibacteriaceae bacterium]|nr:type II toxin-antitoxin system Phd/YefM family antitoxin [Propionibacteriaceae bacterium]